MIKQHQLLGEIFIMRRQSFGESLPSLDIHICDLEANFKFQLSLWEALSDKDNLLKAHKRMILGLKTGRLMKS